MSERRAIQPIAPAGDGPVGLKPAEELAPVKMPEHRPKVERLSISKQWVLPPRPKPGRKPKAASEKPAKQTKPVPATRRNGHVSVVRRVSVSDSKGDATDDSCGLCSHEDGCACEDIGIKEMQSPASSTASPRHRSSVSLPSLDMILNQPNIKMEAVPIKRPGTENSANGHGGARTKAPSGPMLKFKKVSAFEPMQPSPIMSVPSPLESMHLNPDAGCGFCTENTVCVCAETTPQPPAATPVQLPPISEPATESHVESLSETVSLGDDVYGCTECERGPMSMLFCVSLSAAGQLAPGAVAIPCNLAFKTLQKHHKFDGCDLGRLVRRLECNKKMVGVQSINRVLQELERNEFS